MLPISALPAAEKRTTTTPAAMTHLIVGGAPRCAIVSVEDDPLSKRAALRLADYLHEHTGARPTILAEADLNADTRNTLIVIDGTPNHRLLGKLGIQVSVPGDRDDGYQLRVVRQEKRTVIAIAGNTPSGAKFGAYRLMEEMGLSRGSAAVPDLNLTASPFFKTRSIALFSLWLVPIEISQKCNLESWPLEKIRRNIDTYDAFGFNAIETHDRFASDFLEAAYGITREQWRTKVHALSDSAHESGMKVFLRTWGNSVTTPVKQVASKEGEHRELHTPFGYVNLVPDIPEERRRWETEIRDYISQSYASHVDHLITHWADAGGIHPGSNATIKDAMLLHNELRAAFRAINPKIETSMDLWNMRNPRGHRGWPGYVNHRTLTTAGILEKDVMIAQATRAASHPYSQKVTDEIIADGHRAAVWTWRRGDSEERFLGLRIRIHGVMGDYFHNMPETARQLDWHNIERNQHGTASDVNFYIASKLMWDPKTDVDAALYKYCALVFGSANAKTSAEAFLIIEASREVENTYGVAVISKEITANPIEQGRRTRQALAALNNVRLAPGHRSRFPSVSSPQEMLEELRDTLAVIAENAEICAQQLPALDALLQAGKMDKAEAVAKELRKKADAWIGTMAGGVEGFWLKQTLEAKLEPKLLGFRTSIGSAFERKDSLYVLRAPNKAQATAMLQLKPVRRRAEFQFRCMVADAETGEAQNGGFAFGSGTGPNELIRCQVFIDARELRIRGLPSTIDNSVTVAAPNLDPANALDCTVIVDLDQHRVTFKVGDYSVEARLNASLPPIRYYGYITEGTQARFGAIKVTGAE